MYSFMKFYNELSVLLHHRSLNTKLYTDNTIELIKHLKQGWYEFDLPTFEEYKDYYDDFMTDEELQAEYECDFEFDKYYVLVLIENECVFINGKIVYAPYTSEKYAEDWSNCFEYLLSAKPADNLPVQLHYGLISRKVLYDFIPAYRERYLANKNFETQELLNYIKEPDNAEIPMTANEFLKACYLCYVANGVEISNDIIESYNKNADGRHDGLLAIDKDSETEFFQWYHKNHYGHPFEIMRGGNSTHISLYPILNKQTNLYHFELQGKAYTRSIETLNAFVNLRKNNVPVILRDEEVLINRLIETDYVGILPNYVSYSYYNSEFEELFNTKVSDSFSWFEIAENIDLKAILNHVKLSKG